MTPRLPNVVSAVLVASLVCACVSVEVGDDTSVQSQYQLTDARAAAASPAPALGRTLIVNPLPGNSFDDSFSLTYSRAPQQRAAYQFASWSERPSGRLAQLLVDRLAARSAFTSVALSGRGVGGDLQLNLVVDDFYHDASGSPGIARVEVAAELVDRAARKLVARSRFTASSPLDEGNAAGAAQALSRATSEVLDQLVRWVEASAAPQAAAR